MRRVRELGEFGLIAHLAARLAPPLEATAGELGIGDDAALWRPTPGAMAALTTDTMIEGVHFTRGTTPWRDLGWKSLAVNVSDLAAMAAAPRVGLVTLALTGDEAVSDLDDLYAGIGELASAYGLRVVGGDTVRAPQVQVGFTVVGEAPVVDGEPQTLYRHTARPGDLLVVTGTLGDAAGGLRLLLEGRKGPVSLVAAHRRPMPRVREARWLYEQGVRCATDNSDGLAREAALVATASGVGARIDAPALPISADLGAAFGDAALGLALTGGEAYELVLAMPPARFAAIASGYAANFGAQLTAVGAFVPAEPDTPTVRIAGYDGPAIEFEHFPAAPA